MNHHKKTNWSKIPFIFLLVLTGIVSCHFNRNVQNDPSGVLSSADSTTYDSGPLIDLARLDSIQIIYTADESVQRNVPGQYWAELNELLKSARYDTEWNDSGIMIAMIAQDYSLILSYKDKPSEENEWLLIWRTNERIKFRNKWYFVDPALMEAICDRLESWK